MTCALTAFTSIIVAFFFLRNIKVVDLESDDIEAVVSKKELDPKTFVNDSEVTISNSSDDVSTVDPTVISTKVVFTNQVPSFNPWNICSTLCMSTTLWRYSALTLLLVNLHAVFRHLDATLPTYLIRLYGDHVPKGMIYSINPFMIIFLTPIVAALTSKYNHFNMIKYGGYLTGLAPFFLAASTSLWAAACMVVFISFGEAVWSPRVYDYVMTIAPEVRHYIKMNNFFLIISFLLHSY